MLVHMLRTTCVKLSRFRGVRLWLLVLACSTGACAEPRIRRTTPRQPSQATMADLWVEPRNIASRDLFWGPGGRALAPENGRTFTYKDEKVGGYSPGVHGHGRRGT